VNAHHAAPARRQRLGAYAVLRRGDEVLLTQLSGRTTASGRWTLPGGGVDHGEDPADAVVREVHEETGLHVEAGCLLGATSVHFEGTSPRGVHEDYHAVRLVYAATVPLTAPEPRVVEVDGTTVDARWQPAADISSGRLDVVDLVTAALQMAAGRYVSAEAVANPPSWPERAAGLRRALDAYVASATDADAAGVGAALADLSDELHQTTRAHGISSGVDPVARASRGHRPT